MKNINNSPITRRNKSEIPANLSASLTTIANQVNSFAVYLTDFPKLAGETDDTARLQRAINTVNNYVNSTFNTVGNGNLYGVVFLGKGRFDISTVYMKSNVHIIGDGAYLTRINPIGTSGYVIDVENTNDSQRLANVNLEKFTIAPTDNSFISLASPRKTVGGINFSFTTFCNIKDVQVFNVTGMGLNLTDVYDGYIENLVMMYCGTDSTTPALSMFNGVTDLTNATKIIGMRIENCPVLLRISGQGTNYAPRQNQFIGCKLEWGSAFSKSSSGILIENSSGNEFSSCMFVTNEPTMTYPLVEVSSSYGDIRNLGFTGCTFTSSQIHQGWAIDVSGNTPSSVLMTGCRFTSLGKCITGKLVNVVGAQFFDCSAPVIDVNNSLLSNIFAETISGTTSDYIIKLNDQCHLTNAYLTSATAGTVNGLYVLSNSTVYGVEVVNATTGIYLAGSANDIRGAKFYSCTNYWGGISGYADSNTIASGHGVSVSAIGTDQKYALKLVSNILKYHNGGATDLGANPGYVPIHTLSIGTTASRPTSGLFAGMTYFDTTLNKPVWLKSSSPITWVDATGATV